MLNYNNLKCNWGVGQSEDQRQLNIEMCYLPNYSIVYLSFLIYNITSAELMEMEFRFSTCGPMGINNRDR